MSIFQFGSHQSVTTVHNVRNTNCDVLSSSDARCY